MATKHFRSAFHGFNRQDVVQYIEYLNNQHNAKVEQLNNQLRNAKFPAESELQAKLDAALERCALLEAQLAQANTGNSEQELEAYRRAERAERIAQERAQQICTQANAILADTATKAEAATARIAQLANEANAQLQAYQEAVSGTQAVFQEAVDALGAINAE
ncbi:MAG: hypothetical protein J6Q54_05675 [Oscillospiraceae bacterium]|nr:hypothetical protein [Oscillospiraceae bacterium]